MKEASSSENNFYMRTGKALDLPTGPSFENSDLAML